MANEERNEKTGQWGGIGTWVVWFSGGLFFSLTTMCALGLLVLVLISTALNAYLGWELAGLELLISKSAPEAAMPVPANTPAALSPGTEPSNVPTSIAREASMLVPTDVLDTMVESPSTPSPIVTEPPLAEQVSAVATEAAPSASTVASLPDESATSASEFTMTPTEAASPTPFVSTNSYELIPLEGERDSRPAPKHADLSLKLRDPVPIDEELDLVTIEGGGENEPPQLSGIIEPEVAKTYTLHNWDWGCDCKKDLIENPWGNVALVEFTTTPGQPVYIPKRQSDIYQGKYYAVVLYATESALTFVYAREGNLANAYAVHYRGLQVDPNLLKLYRESQGNQLPGLTLDTPVGLTTDKIEVAIRDRGTFMDPRSELDWWK